MAEQGEIVIFPALRISDLKKDVAAKRQRFETSSSSLKTSVKELARSSTSIVKKKPEWIVGGAVSALGSLFAVISIFKRGGLVKKLGSFGGAMLLKYALPLVTKTVMTGIESALRKRR